MSQKTLGFSFRVELSLRPYKCSNEDLIYYIISQQSATSSLKCSSENTKNWTSLVAVSGWFWKTIMFIHNIMHWLVQSSFKPWIEHFAMAMLKLWNSTWSQKELSGILKHKLHTYHVQQRWAQPKAKALATFLTIMGIIVYTINIIKSTKS